MKLSRPSRFVAAFIALVSMLFMQFAVAGYLCPDFKIVDAGESMAMPADADMQGMPGCDGKDAAQPNLCHAHAQAGNQSLDKPQLPHVQPFTAAALTLIFRDIEVAYNPVAAPPDSLLLTRATAPPLSIRNCCFRI